MLVFFPSVSHVGVMSINNIHFTPQLSSSGPHIYSSLTENNPKITAFLSLLSEDNIVWKHEKHNLSNGSDDVTGNFVLLKTLRLAHITAFFCLRPVGPSLTYILSYLLLQNREILCSSKEYRPCHYYHKILSYSYYYFHYVYLPTKAVPLFML